MKKYFGLFIVLFSLVLFSCNNGLGKQNDSVKDGYTKYTINIKQNSYSSASKTAENSSARTLTSFSDYDLEDDLMWSFTYITYTGVESEIDTYSDNGSGYFEITVPTPDCNGYTITASAYFTSDGMNMVKDSALGLDSYHVIYGEAKVYADDESCEIIVGLKKTESGNANVSTFQLKFADAYYDYFSNLYGTFKADLYSFSSGDTTELISEEIEDNSIIFKKDVDGEMMENFEIPSGYYKLRIYNVSPEDDIIEIVISERIIEFGDNEELAVSIDALDPYTTRKYYVTSDETLATGNGISPDYRIYSDDLFAKLIDDPNWTNVKIEGDGRPYITKDFINTTGSNGRNIEYSASYDGKEIAFRIQSENIILDSDCPIIKGGYFGEDPEQFDLSFSSGWNGSKIYISENCLLNLNSVSSSNPRIIISFPDIDNNNPDLSDYYNQTLVSFRFQTELNEFSINLDDSYPGLLNECKFVEYKDYIDYSYFVLRKIGPDGSIYGEAVPIFVVNGKYSGEEETFLTSNKVLYVSYDAETFILNCESMEDDNPFALGTSFKWKLNDNSLLDDGSEITLDLSTSPYGISGPGSYPLVVEATYEGFTKTINVDLRFLSNVETDIPLFNNNTFEKLSSQSGVNTFIGGTSDTIDLWDNSTGNLNIGLTLFAKEDLTLSSYDADDPSTYVLIPEERLVGGGNIQKILNFCFDRATGDMYVLTYGTFIIDGDEVDTKQLLRLPHDTPAAKDYYTLSQDDFDDFTSMAYFNNTVYLAKNSEFTTDSLEYYYIDLSAAEKKVEQTTFEGVYDAKLQCIAADEFGVYICYIDALEDFYIRNINNTGYVSSSFRLTDLNSYGYEKVDDSTVKITDMYFSGLDVYLLINETNSYYISRGGLMKFTLSESGSYQLSGFGDLNYVLGLYLPTATSYSDENGKSLNYSPIADSAKPTNVFCGPQKFIAIKPEKLVIADEGYFTDDSPSGVNLTSNRVVTVDLSKNTLTGINVGTTLFGHINTSSYFYWY